MNHVVFSNEYLLEHILQAAPLPLKVYLALRTTCRALASRLNRKVGTIGLWALPEDLKPLQYLEKKHMLVY